ncbi:putative steryl acetyl hydrolase [Lachnellula hyalina]|uniref:Putative steryl acetyl hydrolase n=1 Tax=Lachnellula hyalina TaxID=1316788 RepID=A0A8H8R1B1_9HELO|nr:putative steryl acetyl hydrolase [Lachnellula hyalina]TVY25940.1 putative steryl acetyl hydrolase [Lachnellula hyalina]
MGSSYFYLEFLLSLLTLLSSTSTFTNPAILALEYTLVPDAAYPVQLEQAMAGYRYVLGVMQGRAERVCVAGDSAGGTVVLSLLLRLAELGKNGNVNGNMNGSGDSGSELDLRPGMAVLISPWITLHSPTLHNMPSDYLDISRLHLYALQYAGPSTPLSSPSISPGKCTDIRKWRAACPCAGFFVMYGSEEVFAPDISKWVQLLEGGGVDVRAVVEEGGIHAWPVVELFLARGEEMRVRGVKGIVGQIRERMGRKEEWVEKSVID